MEKVLGIGGLFFRARNPAALADWYREMLGIDLVPQDFETNPWQQEAGATVFAPFAKDSDYFGDPAKQFMINFRVADMDAMIRQLASAGIEVAESDLMPIGRFARLTDPEGNPIELWEPAEPK